VSKTFTLGRNERLKSRKLIEALFKKGKSYTLAPFKIFYITEPSPAAAALQFGVGVSSRYFKKAVDRNRIKRLVREAWRLQKGPLADMSKATTSSLYIFIIYTGKEVPTYAAVTEKISQVIKRQAGLFKK
jgi:ribonuclease P protein component